MAAHNARAEDMQAKGTVVKAEEKSLLSNGNIPQSKNDEALSEEPVKDMRRLSTIPESEADESITAVPSKEPLEEREWAGSSYSLCSVNKYGSSFPSREVNSPHHQPDRGDDCATLVLTCLFCKFYDFFLMLPGTCETLVSRCCHSYRYQSASNDDTINNDCFCNCEFDCSIFDSCHETSECLELAMEISEVCYH